MKEPQDHPMKQTGLTLYHEAKLHLQQCVKIDEVREIESRAEAMREYARRAKDTDLQAKAIVVRLRSERRLGELLKEQGRKPSERTRTAQTEVRQEIEQGQPTPETVHEHGLTERRVRLIQDSEPPTEPQRPTLEELGVTKKQSARVKSYANMNEQDWEDSIADLEDGISKGTMRPTSNLKAVLKQAKAPPPTWAPAVIYERNWDSPPETEIIRADTEAHVFLWTPAERLPEGIAHLQGTIGARYSCLFAWKGKDSTEDQRSLILYGRIGNPKFKTTKNFKIAFQSEDGRSQLEATLRRVTDQEPIHAQT